MALEGGLNHIMFIFLFLFGVAEVLLCSNLIPCSNPLADRALLYKFLELLKILILLDSLLILCIFSGRFLIIFNFRWMIQDHIYI